MDGVPTGETTAGVRTESWILWRRIAGGLSSGQQRAIADPLLAAVRSLHRRTTAGKGSTDVGFTPQQSIEMWRLLGGLAFSHYPSPRDSVKYAQRALDINPRSARYSIGSEPKVEAYTSAMPSSRASSRFCLLP